jgi:RNA recognition motif 2
VTTLKKDQDGLALRFDNLMEARAALATLSVCLQDAKYARFVLAVRFITVDAYNAMLHRNGEAEGAHINEGNVFVCITRDGFGLTSEVLREMALTEAGRFGAVYARQKVGDSASTIAYRVEFFSANAAGQFLTTYAKGANCAGYPQCFIYTFSTLEETRGMIMSRSHAASANPARMGLTPYNCPPTAFIDRAAGPAVHGGVIQPPVMGYGHTHPAQPRTLTHPQAMGMFRMERPVPSFGQMYEEYPSYSRRTHHTNPVDPIRILRGEDVRTTVMLRNVPNKMDVHEMKDIIDETSFGKYDFSYLRIDFGNRCNVGYAFINFTRPEHIIDFIQKHQGRPWNLYNSDKIAEVSYATRQGIHTLIDAFRNSCVMEEHPDHRPKLWHTDEDGPELSGTEKVFPGPNNMTKLQRSRANAETVGLFPPRGARGRYFEDRHRHSQFDRGTPQAMLDAHMHGPVAFGSAYAPSSSSAASTYGPFSRVASVGSSHTGMPNIFSGMSGFAKYAHGMPHSFAQPFGGNVSMPGQAPGHFHGYGNAPVVNGQNNGPVMRPDVFY